MRACAFFPSRLDPVLDCCKGDKDTVVAPEMPTRGPVGQAILDHEPHRQLHHAMGVLRAGWRQIREVRVKVLTTLRTGVLRIGDHEIPRTPQIEIPQVVQRPLVLLVPIGLVPTPRTRLARGGATGRDDLWRWQVGNRSNPFGGIGSIHPRTNHGCVLRARMLKPALYDKGLSGAILRPGNSATVSRFCRIIWRKGVSTKIRLCPAVSSGTARMCVPSMMCSWGSLTASWTNCRRRAWNRAYRWGSVNR